MPDITLAQIRSEVAKREQDALPAARFLLVGGAVGLAVFWLIPAFLTAHPLLRLLWGGGLVASAFFAQRALPQAQAWVRRKLLGWWVGPKVGLPGAVVEGCVELEQLPQPLEACVDQTLRVYARMEEIGRNEVWRQRPLSLRPDLKQARDAIGGFLTMALRARMIRQTLDRYVPDLQDAERQQQLNARYERRLAECQRFAQRFEQALADLVEVLIIAQDEAWQARGLGERMQEFSRNMDALSHAMREMEKMAEPPEVSLLLPKEPEVFLPPLRENEPPPPPPRQEPPQRS